MISRLLRLRLALGKTQEQMAETVDVSVPTWREVERADPAVGPCLTVAQTRRIFGEQKAQAWYLEGDYRRGREICRALGWEDSGAVAHFEAYLLPEVGRSVSVMRGDDLVESYEVVGSRLDGRKLVYECVYGGEKIDVRPDHIVGVAEKQQQETK